MQKIKKPISILLSVLMVLSVFAVVPFTASAATYDSGIVDLSDLRVGDIITADVSGVDIGGCTVVLKGGRYGKGYADMGRLSRVYPDDRELSSINIRSTSGNFEIMDMDTWGLFVPVDQNGAFANKLIVLAKEGNKITIGGYSEADTPEPLNSSVKYRYYNGEYFRNGNTPAANTYKVVSGNKKWTDGNWYVVTDDVTISERITTSGTVNLVLCDGAKLTAKKGISVNSNNWYNPNQNATLNIYSQSGGTGTLFAGTIDGTSTTMPRRPENAAIGGNDDFQNGSITIHGGNITAIANAGAAGIGGGRDNPCSTVTVYGGNVTAGCTGGYGSGIGGGYYAEGGSVNVAGGHVIAYGLGGEDAAAIGNMAENINLTVADGSEIKAGSSASDAAVVASSNDALKKVYVEINAPALPQAYDITWKMDDGSVLKTKEFAAGTTLTYDGTTPTKADDDNAYTFTGWTPALAPVTADATYTATFDATPYVASVTSNGTTTGYTSFSNAVSAWNNAANGSTLTLLDNVAISNIITINGTKILDLNDHRISMTGTDAIFYIGSGANLTLEDNATEKSTHYYSAAKNGSPGSVSDTADENHPYSFTGGYITGGKGYRTGNWRKGGVAYIAGGTFTINGGTLVGNQASGSGVSGGVEGGTIYATSGSFTLNGGNILADFSSNGAGGVFLEGTATFRMNGGSIKHCYAGYGAVIRNNNSADGAVILSGGTIAENISSHGKIIASGSMTVENVSIINNKGSVRSVIYVSGSPVIKDNTTSATDNTPRNVEVPNGKMINITGELTDGAEICVTMDTPGVFTDTTDTSLNVASKFFSDKSDYIVGKNDAGQLYLSKKLIAGHTLSLDGNIAINFYLDPSAAGLTAADVNSGNLSYSFAWVDQADTKAKVDVAEQARQSQAFTVSDDGKYIIVTCHVCAAEMTCDVDATFTLGDKTESKTYSVRKYCDTVLHPTEEWLNAYKEKYPDGTAKCYRNLEELVEAMLNYGAMAQTKFGINTGTPDSSDTPGTSGKLANEGVTYNPGDVTTAMLEKAIADANPNETADNMNNVAAALGAKWFSTSLIYLDDSTLRHYFVKATDTFKPSDYKANKSNYYYYVEKTGIPAAELDNLQSFTAGSQTFKYSALDFVKGMINSSAADGDSKNLAKALYWYNQAANIYFHEHTPAEAVRENVVPATCTSAGSYDEVIYCSECHEELSREAKSIAIDPTAHTIVAVAEVPATHETAGVQEHYKCSGCGKLFSDAEGTTEITAEELAIPRNKKVKLDELTGDIKLLGGDIVSGTLEGNKKITVEPGATITLENANITSLNGSAGYAGITPLGDATILLVGENSVKGGGDRHAGIFAPNGYTLTIDGTGSLTAAPSNNAAGIGGSYTTSGNIVINGGTINATGAYGSAGIGSAFQHNCGSITINGGNITATGDSTAGAGIGSSFGGTCGKITINGGTITAIGGQGSAGIGASYNGNCGDITINNTVTKVSAQRGAYGPSAIGKGYGSPTCGTVTIGGEVVTIGTSPNPYVYEP